MSNSSSTKLLKWSRLLALLLGVAVASPSVSGCGDKAKKERSSKDDDDDEKPKKKKKDDDKSKSSGDPAKSGEVGVATSNPTGASTAATAQSGKYPDLDKLLGPKDQWNPTVFAKLKEDMIPADVAKQFPGADKKGELGIVSVDVKDQPGVWRWQFLYLGDSKGELAFAEIQFDPKLTSEEFWKFLVEGMKKKYGAKFETPSTRTATWTNSDFKTAELTEETNYEADPPNSFYSISVML